MLTRSHLHLRTGLVLDGSVEKATLLWDGLAIALRHAARLDTQLSWLVVERLPA